jgi:diguanylate cyclase (GGDEF)-like protein
MSAAGAGASIGVMLLSCAGVLFALRARSRVRAAQARADRLRDETAEIVAAAVGFGLAACESVTALRSSVAAALQGAAPACDGVLLYEERHGALECAAAFGARFAYYPGTSVALDDERALPVRAIAAGHRTRLRDAARALHPGDVDAVATPLGAGSGRRCAVVVTAREVLDDETVARLATLGELASPAYRIALEREDDRHRAEYDGLTGLLTPRAFRQRLAALVERARHVPGASLALVFVDTDHFKRWNDTCGHAAGDALLRELAVVLRAFASADRDLVARNGGDEFCLVFAETDKAAAIERAEALRARIGAIDPSELDAARRGSHVAITASIGIAAFPADATATSDLLERADAAMYHSKATGRDAVSYAALDGTFVRFVR